MHPARSRRPAPRHPGPARTCRFSRVDGGAVPGLDDDDARRSGSTPVQGDLPARVRRLRMDPDRRDSSQLHPGRNRLMSMRSRAALLGALVVVGVTLTGSALADDPPPTVAYIPLIP